MIPRFSENNFKKICDQLAKDDPQLKQVIELHGYPPMWTRENTYETLVHIILEQQVSLASALSALKMLQAKTKGISPQAILKFSDEEMRACYVSRQKMTYIRGLAAAIVGRAINLKEFEKLPDDEVRKRLLQLKGIGNWTIDVYLMFVLRRTDIFPIGDLAAVNAIKRLKALPVTTSREEIIELTQHWAPNRTVATMMLWHFYLSNPRKA